MAQHQLISPEERYERTQQVLAATVETFATADARLELFGQQFALFDMLQNAVVTDSEDGIVSVDSSEVQGDSRLAVVGMLPHEMLRMGPDFARFIPSQHERAIETFGKWKPTAMTAGNIADSIAENVADWTKTKPVEIVMHPSYGAHTSAMAQYFEIGALSRTAEFCSPPSAPVGSLSLRPLVALNLESSDRAPEIVGHELTHYIQKTQVPVRTFSSQRQADMRSLRDELQAYHVGAMVKAHLGGFARPVDAIAGSSTNNAQYAVEGIRMITNHGDTDPFRATPQLIENLQNKGNISLDMILHGRIDYADVVRVLQD